jgi:hypothetical protein
MWFRFGLLLVLMLPLRALDQRMAGSQIVTGQHYDVESDADPAETRTMLDHLERFHAHLSQVFAEISPPWTGHEVVRYCRDRPAFLAYGRAHCPGFSEGWYGYQVDATAEAPAELVLMHLGTNRSVLQHEALHRFMARAYPGIRAWPRWFDEGLADWIARGRFVDGTFTVPERLDPQDLMRVRDALSNRTLVPLERLLTLDNAAWNGEGQQLHYAEGYLLAAFLMRAEERPWNGQMRAFMLRLAHNQRYDESFRATLGEAGVARLQHDWSEWLRAQR